MKSVMCFKDGKQYLLNRSQLCSMNWFIKNFETLQIVWNGMFDGLRQAIEAAEMDGYDFGRGK